MLLTPSVTETRTPPYRRIAIWTGLIFGCCALALAAERMHLPAAQMVVGIVVGITIATIRPDGLQLPDTLARPTQALVGVVMGGSVDMLLVDKSGLSIIPLLLITVLTLGLSFIGARFLYRFVNHGFSTVLLGMIAGGSAAVVSMCDDAEADKRVVAVMQYVRVLIVALSVPLLAPLLFATHIAPHQPALAEQLRLVARGDQLAGVATALLIAVLGVRVGTILRLPSARLLGPMLLASAVTTLHISGGFIPTGLFHSAILVMVGLEVGLRFTPTSLRACRALMPSLLLVIVVFCVVVAGLAGVVATFTSATFADAYLATTPGGINAVVASASSLGADMSIVASVQGFRLFLMVLILPLVLTLLRRRSGTSSSKAAIIR